MRSQKSARPHRRTFAHSIAESIVPYFPDLKKKLYLANMA